jgi:hypothetical protein
MDQVAHVATMEIHDVEEEGNVHVSIRAYDEEIYVFLAADEGGEVDLVMNPASCEQLIAALQRALEIARQPVEVV